MGGVIFIDEAYDLNPVEDLKGKPIVRVSVNFSFYSSIGNLSNKTPCFKFHFKVNELLTLCENQKEDISVILAGYEDDFQKKFFAYNDGLKSRFKEIMFEDFDEKSLSVIWTSMRTKKNGLKKKVFALLLYED